jgi:hypothetical protein
MAETLSRWNDGPAKSAITEFVARVTTTGGPELVPPVDRIADRQRQERLEDGIRILT